MPSMMLTDQHRVLVTESFALLVPISDDAAAVFYQQLWTIAPETKPMFQSTDMAAQGLKLMQTLGVIVRALHDLETIRPFMRELGQRHIGYGVTADQYVLVKVALLYMIEYCLGDKFTPEVRAAWDKAYDMLASFAIAAYE